MLHQYWDNLQGPWLDLSPNVSKPMTSTDHLLPHKPKGSIPALWPGKSIALLKKKSYKVWY